MDKIYARDKYGVWQCFNRTEDPNEVAAALFLIFDQGDREVCVGENDAKLFDEAEARARLETLMSRFNETGGRAVELVDEIDSLCVALGENEPAEEDET